MFGVALKTFFSSGIGAKFAVDEIILIGLEKYKATALKMTRRTYHWNILFYDEMEQDYLEHVRFWNYILDADRIGMVFLATTPHHAWEYIIYALAKVKNIPVLFEAPSGIEGYCEVATAIENIGSNTSKVDMHNVHFSGCDENIMKFFSEAKREKYLSAKKKRQRLNSHEKWIYQNFYYPLKTKAFTYKYVVDDIRKHNYVKLFKDIQEKKYYRQLLKRVKTRRRDYAREKKLNISHNNPEILLKKKYVLYMMQVTPEASTLPRAGVFENQILTIKMLSKAAKEKGLVVIVKDHWLQGYREKTFYEQIMSLDNVQMIPSESDTYELIDHAVIVASQTGTCIKEAVIRGIPVLCFASNCMIGAPGVFRVGSVKEIISALDEVMKEDYSIDAKQVEQYYRIMSQTLVKGYLDWPDEPAYDLAEAQKETIMLISKFIESGMREDFCYCKDNI